MCNTCANRAYFAINIVVVVVVQCTHASLFNRLSFTSFSPTVTTKMPFYPLFFFFFFNRVIIIYLRLPWPRAHNVVTITPVFECRYGPLKLYNMFIKIYHYIMTEKTLRIITVYDLTVSFTCCMLILLCRVEKKKKIVITMKTNNAVADANTIIPTHLLLYFVSAACTFFEILKRIISYVCLITINRNII